MSRRTVVQLTLAAAFLVLAAYDRFVAMPTLRDVPGTVVGLYKNQTRRRFSPMVFLVELDNGPTFVVGGTEGLNYRRGARIMVQEERSAVFGLRSYTFERFLTAP